MKTEEEYLKAKMIIKMYESQQECSNGCNWYSVGHQGNGHQQCKTCDKQKDF